MTAQAEPRLFDLGRSEDQRMNQDTMERFAANEIRAVAKEADEAGATPEGFYDKTAELGLSLLPIPEALGGAGMARSPVSNALNAEDLAWGDLGLTLGAISPQAFVNTLLDQGSDAQREKYLPRFCEGTFYAATTALMEPRATFDPTVPQCTATSVDSGYTLNGSKCMVPLGESAELVLVIAQLDNQGPAAFIVEGTPKGMTRTREEHMGLRTLELAGLTFENVELPGDALLGDGSFELQRFVDLSRIGLCALAVGCCQGVLDYVMDYVNERVAFGEPISNRQAVAFMVADMAIELEAMRLMTWRAASRAEQGLDFQEQAYLAKVACAEHAMKIGTDGVQLLGGHGFCREHPVEIWYRNLRAIAILDGVASV
ncbi:MAG: acyl-CoA dehydrogenase family protein [Halieaceae bacterium]|nr:acyl-CoA dehydrogenase family protein [Halieaceae bacterium]